MMSGNSVISINSLKVYLDSLQDKECISSKVLREINDYVQQIEDSVLEDENKCRSEINIRNYAYSLLEKTTQEYRDENKERALLAEKLKLSENNLYSILSSLDSIVWSISYDDNETLFISPRASEFYEIDIPEFYINIDCWIDKIHELDKEKYIELKKTLNISGYFEAEYRIVVSNKEKWLNEKTKIIKNQFGQPIRIDTIITDITNEVHAKFVVNESIERLAVIMDSIEAFIYVSDMQTYELLFVNKYGRDKFNYKTSSICWQVLQSGQTGPCSFCTNHILVDENNEPKPAYHWEFKNTNDDRWYQCVDRAIKWVDGRIVRLEVAIDIDKMKRAEEEIKYQKQILDTIINNAPIGIWMNDKDEKLLFVNNTFDKWTGITSESPSITEEEKILCRKSNQRALESNIAITDIEEVTFLNNGTHSLEVIKRRVENEFGEIIGVIGIGIDITEKLITQEKLIESEKKYRKIFENIQDVFYQTDLSGNLIEISPSIERYSGYKPEEILGKPVSLIYKNPIDRAILLKTLAEKKEVIDYEVQLLHRSGEVIHTSVNTHFIYKSDGTIIGVEGSLRNISERKKTEFALEMAKDEADRANKAKSEFLANMSHEIRTPLNAILGFAELLSDVIDEPKYLEYLKGITTGGRNLLNLINDILDLSKIEAGRLDLQYEPVSLHNLTTELSQIFSLKIKEKNLDFIIKSDEIIPEYLDLDGIRLRQVLLNLLGNAVKFTEKGFVEINIKAHNNLDNTFNLYFKVIDSGKGISEDQMQSIFEAFKQQEGQSNRKYGGTGLGLTISKRLIEMMNGKIKVSSTVGKGSIFEFELHNVTKSSKTSKISNKDENQNIDIVFNNQSILIVEDIYSNILVIKGFLANKNINLYEASNGKEALELLDKSLPDLILLDLQMPVMDGYEFLKIIKTDERYKNIKVIALTASIIRENQEYIEKYCYSLLKKPVSRNELLTQLSAILEYEIIENQKSESFNPPSLQSVLNEINRDNLNAVLSQNDLWNKFRKVKASMFIDEIIEFAQELQEVCKSLGSFEILILAEQIENSARVFDIDKIINIFNLFENLI